MSAPKILVVEDEAIVAMEIERTLKDQGYDVVGIFARGEQAVEGLDNLSPDLILMDIKLAGELDGIQTAAFVREQRDIPVVYLTAHSDEKTLVRALGSEPLGYVVKPFSQAELHATIQVSLNKHLADKKATDAANWFSKATDFIGGAVIVTDEKGLITHMNALAERLTGWNRMDGIGKRVTTVCRLRHSVSGRPINNFALSESTERFLSFSTTSVLVARDETESTIEILVFPGGDTDEGWGHVIFAFWESTDRKADAQDWVSLAGNLLIEAAFSRSDGEYDKATSLYERALAILETQNNSSRICRLLDDLAGLYKTLGRTEEARMLAFRASRIRPAGSPTCQATESNTKTHGSPAYA
jgi:CheY-like chemotaxis protein